MLKLAGRQYDEIYQRAARDRVTVPEQIRREIRQKNGDRATKGQEDSDRERGETRSRS
jgi:hypothetical protein